MKVDSKAERWEPAFQVMALDITEGAWRYADNLDALSQYIVQQVRELTGVRSVILLEYLHAFGGTGHRVASVDPEQCRELAESVEVNRLTELARGLNYPQLWNYETSEGEAEGILSRLGYGMSMAVPLKVGTFCVGALLLLGLPGTIGISQVKKMLSLLSTPVALAFRSSRLYERQELIVQDRTRKLKKANEELHVELTERKRAEEKLRESEERYRMLIQQSVEAIYIFDADTNSALEANPEFLNFLGYTDEEVSGLTVYDFVEHDRDSIDAYIQQILTSGSFSVGERKWRRKDGTVIDVWVTVGKIRQRGKDVIFIIARDITARKRAEEELRESEEKYRLIVENAKEGISIYQELPDGNRKLVECNPQYAEMSGYSREELMQICDTREIQVGHNTPEQDAVNAEEMQAGQPYIGVFSWIRPDGKENYIEYTAARLNLEGRKFTVGIDRDVTERKRAEEQIKASLEEKESLLREIHHRVKNNMQVISSLLKLQSKHIEDEKYSEMFRESQNRIRSMSLVHEKLYRSENFADINFGDYIKSLANSMFQAYEATGKIALQVDVEDVRLGIDSAIPCGLILNELVSNSLKHAFPEGARSHPENRGKEGEIKITLRSIENEIELVVSNNGVRIPEDLDFRKTESLGLHLVTILAEGQLHGKIELDRTAGTSFRIRFKEKENKERI